MRKRDLWILLLALAAAVTVSISIFASSALETGSWGLSFRQEGMPPIGNAGRDQLARLGAAYIGNTEEKVLYLTFDAGYENGCTAQILDVLKAVNDPGHTWSLSDYTHSAWEINKENPTLSFIAELVAEGISYSASGKWSSLNRRLTPAMVKEAVNNEGSLDPLFVENKFLDAGKKLFEAAKKKLEAYLDDGRPDLVGRKVVREVFVT